MSLSQIETRKIESLRDYVDIVDSKGLLKKVENADWNLEVGAITQVVALSHSPKVLLFDSIKDYPKGHRIATNLYILLRLQALVFGLPENLSGVELVRLWKERSKKLAPIPPRKVSSGPIKQNVVTGENVDILKFPIPQWHESDGGRYYGTGDVSITRDPDDGWINFGVYRSQVFNKNTVGVNIAPDHHGHLIMNKYWSKGEPMPIAIVGGHDPYLYAGACMQLPWSNSELEFSGALKGSPIDVIIDEDTNLPIPANAEIAVIGNVYPNQVREEGPFGECTGYYTKSGPKPYMKIEKILHRENPILQGSPPMYGSAMMHALGAQISTSARIWQAVEREVPNIKGVFSLYQQCQAGSEIIAVSLKQAYAGHWKHAGMAALSARAGIIYNKAVIVVDEDIDPSDWKDVIWALVTRSEPAEDVDIIRGVPTHGGKWSESDPTGWSSSTMIINATRPFGAKNFPLTNKLTPELTAKTMAKWGKFLGLQEL